MNCKKLRELIVLCSKNTYKGDYYQFIEGCEALESVYWNCNVNYNIFTDANFRSLTIGSECVEFKQDFDFPVSVEQLSIEEGDCLKFDKRVNMDNVEYLYLNRDAVKYHDYEDVEFKNLKTLILGENLSSCNRNISNTSGITYLESKSLTPPVIPAFRQMQYIELEPVVPAEAIELYRNAPVWKEFWNLRTNGVGSVYDDDAKVEIVGRYDMNGMPVSDNYKGIVIRHYSDGSVRKSIQ